MKGKGADTLAGPITAETLAAQYGVSEKTIRRDGKRAEAIEKLAETQPEQARLTPLHAQCRNATHVPSL